MTDTRSRSAYRSLGAELATIVGVILVTTVALVVWMAFEQLETRLEVAALERMEAKSSQLATLVIQTVSQDLQLADRLAANVELRQYLGTRTPDALQRAAASLEGTPGLNLVWLSVWDDTGERVLAMEGSSAPALPGPLQAIAPSKAGLSRLHTAAGSVYYQVVSVLEGPEGEWFGRVAVARRITSPGTAEALGGLIGEDVTIRIGNTDGTEWSDLLTATVAPPLSLLSPSGHGVYEFAPGDVRFAHAVAVPNTPWTVWTEVHRDGVMATADGFLRTMVLLTLPLLAIGTFAASRVMKRVTRRLSNLTAAAVAMEREDYSLSVDSSGGSEVARLAFAFNTMRRQVQESHRYLEHRVHERTRELSETLEALRQAQEKLVQKERLALLGQLSGGVGHELRNPLGVMTNAVYYLDLVQPDAPDDVKEYLGIIRTQVGVANRIVTDLLDFARTRQPRTTQVPLRSLVEQQLVQLGPPAEGIDIHLDFPLDLPAGLIDGGQIGQVVQNLIVNAFQAMEDGGTLTVRGLRTSDGVAIEVTDTGTGMTPEIQAKLFEPLFTTKARGIGLGLAVSRTLAEANGGSLTVTSQPGEGSTFTLSMPAVSAVAVA